MRRRSFIQALLAVASCIAAGLARAEQSPMRHKQFKLSSEEIKPLVPAMGAAFATDMITVDGKGVGYMYREIPGRPGDSGWRFFSGDEDQAYTENSANTSIYSVNTIANYDPDIIPYVTTPAPCAFEKVTGTHRYRKVDPPGAH